MANILISLPDDLKAQAEARAAESGCASVEEYVEQLVQRDAGGEVEFDEELEQLLLQRMDGPFIEMDATDFAQIREKFRRYLDGQPEQP